MTMQSEPNVMVIENLPTHQIGFDTAKGFELIKVIGSVFSKSNMVPKNFQDNIPDCCIVLNMALRLKIDPLTLMQNIQVINGKPSFSAKFLISTFNINPKFTALRYEFSGKPNTEEWGCQAWCIEKETNTKLTGPVINISLAKKEGWYDKSGSKWKTMPEKMLMYRAAAWFIDVYAPEISMGFRTTEEEIDITPLPRDKATPFINGEIQDEEKPSKAQEMAKKLESRIEGDSMLNELREKMGARVSSSDETAPVN